MLDKNFGKLDVGSVEDAEHPIVSANYGSLKSIMARTVNFGAEEVAGVAPQTDPGQLSQNVSDDVGKSPEEVKKIMDLKVAGWEAVLEKIINDSLNNKEVLDQAQVHVVPQAIALSEQLDGIAKAATELKRVLNEIDAPLDQNQQEIVEQNRINQDALDQVQIDGDI